MSVNKLQHDRLVSSELLNARWFQLKWIAVQTADCRRHGRISDYMWKSIDAAAADEPVNDHHRAYLHRTHEDALCWTLHGRGLAYRQIAIS